MRATPEPFRAGVRRVYQDRGGVDSLWNGCRFNIMHRPTYPPVRHVLARPGFDRRVDFHAPAFSLQPLHPTVRHTLMGRVAPAGAPLAHCTSTPSSTQNSQ